MTMKPHIEYRASLASKIEEAQAKKSADIRAALDDPKAFAKLQEDVAFIVIRRDRAKYNAYMRAYRARKKAEK